MFKKRIVLFIFLLSLQGCNNDVDLSCSDIGPLPMSEQPLWGPSNSIAITSRSNNPVAIACHNCFSNNSNKVAASFNVIESAINSLVDIVELDVVFPKENYQQPMVSHDLDSSHVSLSSVLSNQLLLQSSVMLFIEVKGKIKNEQYIRDLLDTLMTPIYSTYQHRFINADRLITLRSFEHSTTLLTIQRVLAEDKYSSIKPFIKLSRLHFFKEESEIYAEIEQSYQCGMSMVEFDYRLGVEKIKSLNMYAEAIGMSVNVFTIDESNYIEAVQGLKEHIDVITVDVKIGAQYSSSTIPLFERVRELIVKD